MQEDLNAIRRDVDNLMASGGVDPSDLVDLVYPIGSIYMSVGSTSPATLFGGSWERIQDKFLLASGSTYANGATGGAATHTLSEAEMPSHNHGVSVTSSGTCLTDSQGAHQHGVRYDFESASGTSKPTLDSSGSSMSGNNATSSTGAHQHWVPNHTHTISESSKGSGSAHNNMPPYLAVYVWKRTA